ncbi:helix-turn-helix domain-containing protein [Streptomyces liliifuscus]|uniref:Helix-turn-helix transcriptional regulator n=1 Tax=Streptomyces liliifuscus TaxID=2797636 RepID=A0A7T7RFS3_9ACTN|nr:helix-turn-helix transcriptional regulator [Streptomyces liliifuscus]QQM44971.1 helix-turn-helix transcriptional regulator [Streptomyces liliifuscus]
MEPQRNQDPARVRRKRIEAGLTQIALAAQAGLSTAHMSCIERGERGASPKVLDRLATALDCEIADLMPPLAVPVSGSAA